MAKFFENIAKFIFKLQPINHHYHLNSGGGPITFTQMTRPILKIQKTKKAKLLKQEEQQEEQQEES